MTGRWGGWERQAVAAVRADAHAILGLFPVAGRMMTRAGQAPPDAQQVAELRVRLLAAVPLAGPPFAELLTLLYRRGDPAERRAVLLALDCLAADRLDPAAAVLPLVYDALRANDPRLVAAALGRFGAAHAAPAEYRQGVLKCAFIGVPLTAVAGLPARLDDELRRMLRDLATERRAAGRPVPGDVLAIVEGR